MDTRTIPRDELAVSLAGRDDPDVVERLTALLMAADEAFWSLDLRDRSIRVSRGMEVAFGHRLTDIGNDLGKWEELIHPADLPSVLAGARAALASDAAMWSHEMRLRVVDGSYTLVRCRASILRDATGRAVCLVGSLSDVSARVSEMAELRSRTRELQDMAAEARDEHSMRRLVERATDEVVWEWNTATNEVRISGATRALLGYDQAELEHTATWWSDRIHPDDRAGVQESLAKHLADDLEEWMATYRLRRADGTDVWVRDRGYLEPERGNGHRLMAGAMRLVDVPNGPATITPIGRVRLSPRQAEVLELVRAGYTNKQIADRLRMGEQSAKEHVSRLLRIMGAPNRAALVAAADDVEVVRDRRSGSRRVSDSAAALLAVTRGPDHVLVSASPALLALTPGRSPLGKPLRTGYPELAGQGVLELFDVVHRDGKSAGVERLFGRLPRGSRVRVAAEVRLEPITDEHGRVDGVLAYGADVSRRTRADAAPTAGLTEQMSALESLPIGAVLSNASGQIISMNAEARRILGAGLADGRPIQTHAAEYRLRDALTGRSLGPNETAVARALRGETVSRLDYVLRPPGTSTDVALRTSAMPVHGPDGIVAVLLTFSELERRPAG